MLIDSRTVFVLGAGASKPLGFPLASELKTIVEQSLLDPEKVADLASALYDKSEASRLFPTTCKLSELLSGIDRPSIDACLEYHRKAGSDLDIARSAVAQALLPFEDEDRLLRDSDWYGAFFDRVLSASGFAEFERNSISFITFNYDRSLEQYLFLFLSRSSGEDRSVIARKLAQIPIIHMYGKLGSLPWQHQENEAVRYGIGDKPSHEAIRRAFRSLRLIRDPDISGQFDTARDLMEKARFVFFLGFGYHSQNLERLKPERLFSTIYRGTAFKEPPGKQADYKVFFKELFKGAPLNFFLGPTPISAEASEKTDCRQFIDNLSLRSLVRTD